MRFFQAWLLRNLTLLDALSFYFLWGQKLTLIFFFTLQYCIGFATHQHESTTGVHVFRIPNPPSTSPHTPSQCTSPKHPAPCIEHRLVIRLLYDIIHVWEKCHSPKSSHPLPLPQSPKDCSIHTQWNITHLNQF